MSDTVDKVKAKLRPKKEEKKVEAGLSSGSTLLNLAISGSRNWAFGRGTFHLLVGDSRAGKSFCALTALAEAANNPSFDNYRLIYDEPEHGARMDMKKFFGSKLLTRLEREASLTVEEFYFRLDDLLKEGTPFIYVMDSENALDDAASEEKFAEQKEAFRKGKETSGSYQMTKPKYHSSHLGRVVGKIEKTGSILLMISQSRDNVGFGAQFNPKTRSGGRALTFWATSEPWFSVKGSIKKTVKSGKSHVQGTLLEVKIRKNRDTGRAPVIEIPHYPSTGLDDLGSMVNYLIDEKYWQGSDKKVVAPEFNHDGSKESLIKKIEDGNREKELKSIVSQVWSDVEAQLRVERKQRFL